MALLALPPAAGAQVSSAPSSPNPEAQTGRFVFGPLSFQPRFEVSNVGIDSNVFNDARDPVRDFTATAVPSVESRLRLGRTFLTGKTSFELLYFKKARQQRAFNVGQTMRFDAPLARVRPFVYGGQTTTNQRPNSEIDQRVQQTITTAGAGAEFVAGARTRVGVSAERRHTDFGGVGDDRSIADALSRRSETVSGWLKVDLTPLTSVVVRSEMQNDRFDRMPERDAHSALVAAGFEFKPFALISGNVLLGYRNVQFDTLNVPNFSGVVAAVSVSYLVRETTRFAVTAGRAPEFSVEANEPYYVKSNGGLTVTQSLGGKWDAQVRWLRELLTYERLTTAGDAGVLGRRDRLLGYGTGIGYRLQPGTRLGVDVLYGKRLSPDDDRRYAGYRVGGSVTYDY